MAGSGIDTGSDVYGDGDGDGDGDGFQSEFPQWVGAVLVVAVVEK
jgi:hypothetical protein